MWVSAKKLSILPNGEGNRDGSRKAFQRIWLKGSATSYFPEKSLGGNRGGGYCIVLREKKLIKPRCLGRTTFHIKFGEHENERMCTHTGFEGNSKGWFQ